MVALPLALLGAPESFQRFHPAGGLRGQWLPEQPRESEEGKTNPLPMHTGFLRRLAGGSSPKVLKTQSCPSPVGKMSGSPVQKPSPHRFISTKVLLAEGEDTPFTEHCRHYEDSYRVRGLGSSRVVSPHPFFVKI